MKKLIAAVIIIMMVFCSVGCVTGEEREIAVVGREEGSGTREAFENLVVGINGEKITETGYVKGIIENNSTGLVKAAVAGNRYAIGYMSLGAVDETVKVLDIEGKKATIENIQTDDYDLWRPFEVLIDDAVVGENGTGTAVQKDFALYLESKECQEVIAASSHGYANNPDVSKEWSAPAGLSAESGEVKILGSTSVEPLMAEIISAYCEAAGLAQDVFSMVAQGSSYGREGIKEGTCQFGMASSVTKIDDSYPSTVRKVNSEVEGDSAGQLCRDGLAIVVHPENELKDISVETLFNIYTGSIRKFSEIV